MEKTTKRDTEKAKAPAASPEYTAAELADAAEKVFGVSPDIVTAALHVAGIKHTTIEAAATIIKKFATKEVK